MAARMGISRDIASIAHCLHISPWCNTIVVLLELNSRLSIVNAVA